MGLFTTEQPAKTCGRIHGCTAGSRKARSAAVASPARLSAAAASALQGPWGTARVAHSKQMTGVTPVWGRVAQRKAQPCRCTACPTFQGRRVPVRRRLGPGRTRSANSWATSIPCSTSARDCATLLKCCGRAPSTSMMVAIVFQTAQHSGGDARGSAWQRRRRRQGMDSCAGR